MGLSRACKRYTDDEEQFVADHLPYWRLATIAEHLDRTPEGVRKFCWRRHLAPTTQHLLTSGEAAALCGRSAQWLTQQARRQRLPAHRVPGGRWWLFHPADLPPSPRRRPERLSARTPVAPVRRQCSDPTYLRLPLRWAEWLAILPATQERV